MLSPSEGLDAVVVTGILAKMRFPVVELIKNRFDIKIKILYLQNREKWAYMYFYHLLLWGNGQIYESDGTKHSYDDFLVAFESTLQSLKYNGWKGSPIKSVLMDDGAIYPLEGAHRLASCMHLGIVPHIELVNTWHGSQYDDEYFRRKGMMESEIKKIVYAYRDWQTGRST